MSDTKHYKCASCGAPINYVPGSDELVCEYCGSVFPISEVTDGSVKSQEFQWSNDVAENLTVSPDKEYVCKSCGATLKSFDSSFVTICPYCGNNISETKITDEKRPNLIIPFKIKKEEVKPLVNKYLKKKKLLPAVYAKLAAKGDLKGVYVPFWLFNCSVDGNMTLEGQIEISRTSTNSDGKTETEHETEYYRLERETHFKFEKLPVDASTHFDNRAMDALEPFDYSEITDFTDAYFTGYLAEKFNSTPKDEKERTKSKIGEGILDYFRATERKYDTVKIQKDNTELSFDNVKYAMLPIYTLNFTYKDKKQQIYMNGQNGKIVGDLPVKKAKAASLFFGVFIGILAICSAVSFFF